MGVFLTVYLTLVCAAGKSYYIDSNGGRIDDAIEVTCNLIDSTWFTCIKPAKIQIVSGTIICI